jgi:hypothetical protein
VARVFHGLLRDLGHPLGTALDRQRDPALEAYFMNVGGRLTA